MEKASSVTEECQSVLDGDEVRKRTIYPVKWANGS